MSSQPVTCMVVVAVAAVTFPQILTVSGQQKFMKGDTRHKVKMGEAHTGCDDGVNNLEIDWNDDPRNYTCYHPTKKILPKLNKPVVECEHISPDYAPAHFCMGTPIQYNVSIPTFGDHRPIWPKFGEYKFVPAQRWLHNIEHGAVVMLYHPCTHPTLVQKLRRIVTGCIRKHVITPSNLLTENQPLALVAWGCRLLMSDISLPDIISFIRSKGLKGPEGTYSKEGQYVKGLLKLAEIPLGSSNDDKELCPQY